MAGIGRRAGVAVVAFAIIALALTGAEAADAKQKAPPKVRTATASASVSGAFNVATATATCPGKTTAIGGGFTSSAPALPTHWLNIYESRRVGENRWRVSGVEQFAGSDSLTAYVYCETVNPKARIKTVTATSPLGALDTAATSFATCRNGSKAFSGGFATPRATAADSSYVSRATGARGTGWVVDATNIDGTAPRTLTAYAYCAFFGKLKQRSASVALTGPANTATTASTPACPNKARAHSGGFATSTPVGGLMATALVYESRALGKGWTSSASASGASTSSTLVSTGYCAG